MRQIRKVVTNIASLLKDFRSLKNTASLDQTQVSPTQTQFLVTQIERIHEMIEEQADILFSLQMCEKYHCILPFFSSNRPNLSMMQLVDNFEKDPPFYASFMSRRLVGLVTSS